jgi:uncharacterized protein YecT (DUF1311 family)
MAGALCCLLAVGCTPPIPKTVPAAPLAPAESPSPEPTAAAPQDQNTMNRTAADDFRRADDALNRAYRELQSALAGRPERQAHLKTAQRAWIAFRDVQARFDASEMEGGSAYPLLHFGSLRRTTEARTRALEETRRLLRDR